MHFKHLKKCGGQSVFSFHLRWIDENLLFQCPLLYVILNFNYLHTVPIHHVAIIVCCCHCCIHHPWMNRAIWSCDIAVVTVVGKPIWEFVVRINLKRKKIAFSHYMGHQWMLIEHAVWKCVCEWASEHFFFIHIENGIVNTKDQNQSH